MGKELNIEKIIKRVQSDSDKKIQQLLKDQTEKLIEVFDDKMKIVEDGFKGVHEKLDSHTEQIGSVLVDLSAIKMNVVSIDYEIGVRMSNKLDKKHFAELDTRMRRLEKK